MKLKQMNTRLRQYQSRLSKTIKTTLPVKVGALAKSHYQQNFREAGYVDGGLHPWKPAKRQGVARGASGRYTPLLSRRAYLMRSIRYEAGEGKVKVINDVPYAKIHNEGGTITSHPRVTPKMRKFAWAMYYKALGGKRRQGRAGKGKKTEQPSGNISAEAQRWKKLALTRKTQLTVRAKIPKRQFMGKSRELDSKLHSQVQEIINKTLK